MIKMGYTEVDKHPKDTLMVLFLFSCMEAEDLEVFRREGKTAESRAYRDFYILWCHAQSLPWKSRKGPFRSDFFYWILHLVSIEFGSWCFA